MSVSFVVAVVGELRGGCVGVMRVRIANAIPSGGCEVLMRWLVVGLIRKHLSRCSDEIQLSLFARVMWGDDSKAVGERAHTVVEPVESW